MRIAYISSTISLEKLIINNCMIENRQIIIPMGGGMHFFAYNFFKSLVTRDINFKSKFPFNPVTRLTDVNEYNTYVSYDMSSRDGHLIIKDKLTENLDLLVELSDCIKMIADYLRRHYVLSAPELKRASTSVDYLLDSWAIPTITNNYNIWAYDLVYKDTILPDDIKKCYVTLRKNLEILMISYYDLHREHNIDTITSSHWPVAALLGKKVSNEKVFGLIASTPEEMKYCQALVLIKHKNTKNLMNSIDRLGECSFNNYTRNGYIYLDDYVSISDIYVKRDSDALEKLASFYGPKVLDWYKSNAQTIKDRIKVYVSENIKLLKEHSAEQFII